MNHLLGITHLATTALAGHQGLDRDVTWAYVSDERTPWDWGVGPGDLVLTSGWIIPEDGERQAEFVERLSSAGASGLVVGDNTFPCPSITDRMLQAADRCGFPLLKASYEVAFTSYVRTIAAANSGEENRSLQDIMRIHNEVRVGLVHEHPGAELVRRLEDIIECPIYLVEPEAWETLLPDCVAPDPAWRAPLESELAQRRGLAPPVMHLRRQERVALASPIPVERSAFLLVTPDGKIPRVAVLQHVASALALELTRVDAELERQRRSGSALLTEALAGRLEATVVASGLGERGLRPPWVAVAIRGGHHALDHLVRRWGVRRVPHVLSGIEPAFVGVLGAHDAGLDDLAALADRAEMRVGVSDPFSGASGLADAARQARWALEAFGEDAYGVARYGDGGNLLLPRTLTEARFAAQQILGGLLAYDEEHHTNLVHTLETYLECERSPKRSAERLFVHNQTINYRISRIEEITGRSLRSTSDISELWLGLRARALSASSASR